MKKAFLFPAALAVIFMSSIIIIVSPVGSKTFVSLPTPTVELANAYFDPNNIYQINYPKNWQLIEHSSNFFNIQQFQAPDLSIFQITYEKSPQNLIGFLNARDQLNEGNYEGRPSIKVLSSNNTRVNTYPSIEREEQFLAANFTAIVTYVKTDNYIFTFTAYPQNSQAQKEYYKMLDSFHHNAVY